MGDDLVALLAGFSHELWAEVVELRIEQHCTRQPELLEHVQQPPGPHPACWQTTAHCRAIDL